MGLSPQQAKKILDANLINLAKKVSEGKALSAQELALVQTVAQDAEPASGVVATPTFAKDQNSLAGILGVNRKTVQRWLKIPGNPGATANGDYSVVAWREFAKLRGHTFEEDDDLDQTGLKAKQILLQNKRLAFDLAVDQKLFVKASDVEKWGAELGVEIKKIVHQIHSIAPSIVGLSVPEADSRLREMEDEILSKLHLLEERVESLKPDEPTPEGI